MGSFHDLQASDLLRMYDYICMYCVCLVTLVTSDSFATPWTVAFQAPLSVGFSRQKCWSGLPCPPPGDLSNPGIEPTLPASPALQAGSLPQVPPGKQGSPHMLERHSYSWFLPDSHLVRTVRDLAVHTQ